MNSAPHSDIRAVLFDVGNTLLYPDYAFIRAVLAQHGIETSEDALMRTQIDAHAATLKAPGYNRWNLYFSTWLKTAGAPEAELPAILRTLWERHRQRNLWSRVHPEARSVLETLQNRGYVLGAVSNADGRVVRQLQEVELDGYFATIIDSEVVGVRKPDPEIFRLALKELDLLPQHGCYVGDTYEIDVLGARRVGMMPILLDPFNLSTERQGLRIQTLAQLPSLLQNLSSAGTVP